ncbi:hypothetical protein ACFSUK_20070 [Sphingobium scionense]
MVADFALADGIDIDRLRSDYQRDGHVRIGPFLTDAPPARWPPIWTRARIGGSSSIRTRNCSRSIARRRNR